MRGVLTLLAAATIAGCANDMTAPAVQPQPASSLDAVDGATGPWHFGRHGSMGLFMARRLPANLQLTQTQRNQIRALTTSFRTANQTDLSAMRTSMRAVMQQLRAARSSGHPVSIDQRRALLQPSAPLRQRLLAAQQQLAAGIQNVLTTDQKAWLAAHRPAPCASAERCRARFARRGGARVAQMRNPS
jgi:Spy/CpxP family protein refolding chaperone